MENEERTNIAPEILLGSLCGGLPNELFKLNEKENSKKGERDERRTKERRGEKFQRTKSEVRKREGNRDLVRREDRTRKKNFASLFSRCATASSGSTSMLITREINLDTKLKINKANKSIPLCGSSLH